MMCEWDVAQFLIFSTNGEPLIYYSHLTSIVIFLALLGFTLLKLKQWPRGAFRLMAIAYIVWLFCDLVLWANDNIEHVLFFWTLINLVEPLIFVAAFAYCIQFIDNRTLSSKSRWAIFALLFPTLVMAPMGLSVVGFDYTTCDRNVVEGIAAYYNYFLEALFVFLLLLKTGSILIYKRYAGRRVRLTLVVVGTSLLLFSFLIANFLGTFTGDYVTSQYGHIAVPIFAAFLAYITIKYESFEPRILLVDTLVVALFILLLSLLFVEENNYQIYANALAFAIMIPLGYTLVTSIRKEVKTRKEIQQLATNLESANGKLKELDQLKSEFLSVATHQLRAPLTAIRGYAANISEGSYGAVPEYLNDPLHVIQESTRLMVNSIEDYLNISRIEQGRMKYEKSDFDISDISKRVIEELLPVATKKGLALTLTANEPITVNADIGKIKQVLTNLVDNAIKYTEKGSIAVTVEKKEKVARVTITDSGVGIAADEIDKLFSKFTRARAANEVNTTGTGLGLYVAKQLVEGNGGKVWVESDGLGKGSRFVVELPV
ncbi:MAG: ATP-binding protein [Patescibacteria group bacterium]